MTKHQKPHFTGFQFFRKWGIYENAEDGIIQCGGWSVECGVALARNVRFRKTSTHKKPKAFPTPNSSLLTPNFLIPPLSTLNKLRSFP